MISTSEARSRTTCTLFVAFDFVFLTLRRWGDCLGVIVLSPRTIILLHFTGASQIGHTPCFGSKESGSLYKSFSDIQTRWLFTWQCGHLQYPLLEFRKSSQKMQLSTFTLRSSGQSILATFCLVLASFCNVVLLRLVLLRAGRFSWSWYTSKLSKGPTLTCTVSFKSDKSFILMSVFLPFLLFFFLLLSIILFHMLKTSSCWQCTDKP